MAERREGQGMEQPSDQDAVGLRGADVVQAMPVLGVVESVVFDLPAALGHPIRGARTTRREEKSVSQRAFPISPFGLVWR